MITLESSLLKEQPPSIIENRSTITSKMMISIRKERSPDPLVNMENPYLKHLDNVSTVERKVILEKSVDLRPNPLSTL